MEYFHRYLEVRVVELFIVYHKLYPLTFCTTKTNTVYYSILLKTFVEICV